jgi:hypothetical protein
LQPLNRKAEMLERGVRVQISNVEVGDGDKKKLKKLNLFLLKLKILFTFAAAKNGRVLGK